jgi:hypothetical protein
MQKYYDYFCSNGGCAYKIIDSVWTDTGKRRDKICKWDEICVDGECISRSCEGSIGIKIKKAVDPDTVFILCPRDRVRATAIGDFKFCKGLEIQFREGSCDGELFGTCKLNSKSECSKSIRFTGIGNYALFACLDKNKDGDFDDEGEQTSVNIDVDCNNCAFNRCPSVAGCHKCSEYGGARDVFVNPFHESVCLNPDQACAYS